MNKKGITLIELVVVIIILILLAVIAIWGTSNTVKKAELTSIYTEFKAVYDGAIQLQNFYNTDPLEAEYELGKDYCDKFERDGKTWYVIYGLNMMYDYSKTGEYSDEVIHQWGLDELKRSYEVTLDESHITVKYYSGDYVTIDGYKVYSYDDAKALQESGAI